MCISCTLVPPSLEASHLIDGELQVWEVGLGESQKVVAELQRWIRWRSLEEHGYQLRVACGCRANQTGDMDDPRGCDHAKGVLFGVVPDVELPP